MKLVITGGNGFIGTALVQKLRNTHNITILDMSVCQVPFENVHYVQGNFSNKDLLRNILPEQDMVIHLAHSTVPSNSIQDPIFDVETNVIGTLHLMQAMEECGVRRMIYMSSGGAVYGPSDTPVAEDAPLKPVSNYGIGKATIEYYVRQFEMNGRLDAVILRPSNIYGPRKDKIGQHGVISTILHCLKHDKPFHLWGSDQITKDYLYIEDFCDATDVIINQFNTGTYNIGSGYGITLLQLIQECESVSRKGLFIEKHEVLTNDVFKIILNCSHVLNNYAWKPKYDIKRGIKSIWDCEEVF
jgi:UDP-glucose 4-epimerase